MQMQMDANFQFRAAEAELNERRRRLKLTNRWSPFETSPIKWHRFEPQLYADVHRKLQYFQGAGAACMLLTLTFWSCYDQFPARDWTSTTTFVLAELLVTLLVGYLMGSSRIPVNYVSLMLIWFLVFYFPLEVKSLPWSSDWISSATGHSLAIAAAAVATSCFIGSRSKLRIGQSGIGILVTNTLGTSLSAGLVFLSIVILGSHDLDEEWSRQLTSKHFRMTLLWAYVTTAITFCNLGFVLRTVLVSVKRKRFPGQLMKKTILEALIWAMTTLIPVPYVAAIQPQLTLDEVYSSSSVQTLLEYLWFMPFPVLETCDK